YPLSAHGKAGERNLHRPIDVYRGDQSRSRTDLLPDRSAARQPAQYGFVAELWVGEREQKLSSILRPAFPWQRQWSRCLRQAVDEWFSRFHSSGRSVQ